MADLAARTASGAAWTYASYATGRAVVFIGMATLARILRPEDYGLFNMAAVLINMLEGAYDLGLRRGLIYFGGAVRAWSLQRTGFALSLGTGLVLTAVLFAISPLAARFYGEPRVSNLMQVLSVYFGIACLGVVPDALLQHRLAFNRRFWPAIAGPAGRYAIAIPLAVLGFGAWSLAWGQLIGISLEVLLLLVLADWRPQLGWSSAAAHQLLRYSSQVSLVEWTAALGFNLDYLLVGHFLGSTVLGVYTLAFKLPDSTIGAAGWVGSRVLLPALVEFGDHGENIGEGLVGALRVAVALLTPLGVALCFLTPQIVPLLFGDQWLAAVPVVQLLVLAACLNGVSQVIGAAFMAAGQPRRITVAQLAWLGMLVPVLFVAAQTNIIAVALTHLVAMLVYVGTKVALLPGAINVRLGDVLRAVRPGLLATAVMALALGSMARFPIPLPVQLTAAGLAYLLALCILARRSPRQASTRNRRLRVAVITQSFYPRIGGAETNLQSLIQPLRQIGVDVEVLTRCFENLRSSDVIAGARVLRMSAPGGQVRASLTFVLSIVWLMVRRRCVPDVIHAHELRSPTLAAVSAGLLIGRPVVAHVLRGGLLGDVRVLNEAPLGKPRLWLFRVGVTRFVALSRETYAELVAAGVPDQKIRLIPYGVDPDRFRPAQGSERCTLRHQLAFDDRKVVLVLARLVPEKRFDHLLAAWPSVTANVADALLVLVGDGPERQRLEFQATSLHGVRFVGEARDPVPYLQAADCLTLPSSTEGQPISLLEAMSTGLICVGTNIGGISDILDDGRLGVLVPPGDVTGLARALVNVLRLSEPERAALSRATRREILEHHSVEANAVALRRLYEELM